jgi:triosephosphate isomerase
VFKKMRFALPVLFINFKTYAEATGKSAVSLAKKAAAVAAKENVSIVLVVQAADLRLVSQKKSISRAKKLGLTTMVCAESVVRAKQVASFPKKPELIALEPPDLIGGNVSVSTAKPRLIRDGVKAIKEIAPKITVITGAGIKNAADVEKAVELGTRGVFVSSGIVKAQNQERAIRELVSGFKR